MHLSGAILLVAYLIPLAWPLGSSDDASGDDVFVVPAVRLFICLVFHVCVQIPSGLLGAMLSRERSGSTAYASTLAIAGAITALLLLELRLEDAGDYVRMWAFLMVRGVLPLAAYVWVIRLSQKNA